MGMKWITYFLALASIFLAVKAFVYVQRQPVWNPVDELAHMDYIEKIGNGILPKTHDAVSEDLFQSIGHTQFMLPPGYDGTRNTLSLANLSYEAQQPPAYYALLAIPDKIMVVANADVTMRVKALRLISFLLVLTGTFLYLPIFRLLEKILATPLSAAAWLSVIFTLCTSFSNRYGLGNDRLSLLANNLMLLFLLRSVVYKQKRDDYLFALAGVLAGLTKYTNLPWIAALVIIHLCAKRSQEKKIFAQFHLLILLLLPLWMAWNFVRETGPVKEFALMLPAGHVDFRTFLQLLLGDMTDLSFLGIRSPHLFDPILAGWLLSFIFVVYKWKKITRQAPWMLFSGGIIFLLLCAQFLLNRYVAGVHWYAYRHYSGYSACWFIACSGWLYVFFLQGKRTDQWQK
jgi:hypothetical protein